MPPPPPPERKHLRITRRFFYGMMAFAALFFGACVWMMCFIVSHQPAHKRGFRIEEGRLVRWGIHELVSTRRVVDGKDRFLDIELEGYAHPFRLDEPFWEGRFDPKILRPGDPVGIAMKGDWTPETPPVYSIDRE